MNEIQLSKDLNVITAEIQSYKQIAGQSIFEIGRRLNHVKENDLSHGEFGEWLESIEIERSFATRVMKVSKELGDSNYATWNNLSHRALYEIATLPKEEREKEHVTSKGETKTVDEMTVRELQEVKKKLKQAEQQAETERQERERLEEELSNIEPEKIEVIPDDYDFYKGNYESAVRLQNRYKEQMEEMRRELTNKGVAETKEVERLKSEEKCLKRKINSLEKLHDVQTHLEIVISQVTTKTHSLNITDLRNEYQVLDDFEKTLDEVIGICNQLKDKLPNKNTIEGEIIND